MQMTSDLIRHETFSELKKNTALAIKAHEPTVECSKRKAVHPANTPFYVVVVCMTVVFNPADSHLPSFSDLAPRLLLCP